MIVGMGLGMMPLMHVGIRNRIITAPGAFALNLPKMTVMGFLMLHLVYGVLVAVVYEAVA